MSLTTKRKESGASYCSAKQNTKGKYCHEEAQDNAMHRSAQNATMRVARCAPLPPMYATSLPCTPPSLRLYECADPLLQLHTGLHAEPDKYGIEL